VKPTDLRGILQYIPQFRERTFIISIDGAIVTDENFANILLDVAVLRSLNIRVVLVHGAAAQIKALADEQHIKPSNLDGGGVTDATLAGPDRQPPDTRNSKVFGQRPTRRLHQCRHRASDGYPSGCGPSAHRQGRTRGRGTVTGVAAQIVPVIPPLGFDGDGKTYRVNRTTSRSR
jgi:amino-acid N-acetyltransferase